jgi:hypothetical protein
MLTQLQDHLAAIYRADPGYDVSDFLITDPRLARILGVGSLAANIEETVLVKGDEGGLSIGVYLDDAVLNRLQAGDPLKGLRASSLRDLWTVLEGVSHFNYIAWNARMNRCVSLLELEMQAEIDKFVSALFLALAQDDEKLVRNIHRWLFDEVSFHEDLTNDQLERYTTANNYAARFCHGLHARLTKSHYGELQVLRRFYRLTQTEKISHINNQAFTH